MTTNEIRDILGIHYPMLLLDRVNTLEPQKFCHAIKGITYNEWFFPAHYPNEPVMPGMLLIEALTQAAALTVLCEPLAPIPQKPLTARILLAGVDKCRFYQPVVPGDSLEIFVNINRFAMCISQAAAQGKVNGKLVCEAKISHKVIKMEEQ